MKVIFIALLISFCITLSHAQQNTGIQENVEKRYFTTNNMEELMNKFVELPCGINIIDSMNKVIDKLEIFLKSYVTDPKYSEDKYALASCLEALKGVKEGGYGIGAVLIDDKGNILASGHNEQIQLNRSDLHGEITLLTNFEQSEKAKAYMNGYTYKKRVWLFTSLEPCPMCFIRIAEGELNAKYSTPDPDGGMITKDCLPPSWRARVSKYKFEQGNCSPVLQKTGHLLAFYTFLDGRGTYKNVSE
ncbi:MAG: nucleoside deaminase [Chitinophagaceae bacterium]